MSDDHRENVSFATEPSGPDRRGFLTGLGAAACAGLLAMGDSSGAKADRGAPTGPGPRKKGPAPTSGLAGIKELLARKEPVAWVFTGDDITQGAVHTKGFAAIPNILPSRVRWELKRMRDLVINSGVSGEKAEGLLADLDWRVLHLKPDVVSIMLGTNDCTLGPVGHALFRKNLTALVNKVMGAGAIVILNTPSTVYLKNVATGVHLAAYGAQIVRDVLGPRRCWSITTPSGK